MLLDMQAANKVYLITGATDGIGLHTARSLAGLGAHVLVHGRSEARVRDSVDSITRSTGNELVHGYTADFSSLSAITQLASDITRQHPKLHVFVNNAGVYEPDRRVSEDGLEMTWAVNVVAPFLLTALLMGTITERIVNVSSISASRHIDFDNLQQERMYSAHDAYAQSKLCSMMFTFQLAQRLQAAGSAITANCLDPGTVNTKMLYAGWGPIGIDVKDANDELVLATDPALAGVSGAYFVSKSRWPAPEVALQSQAQLRLWSTLEQQAGVKFPV